MNVSKVIGSVLILVGTSIGAGILALPMVSASSGFLMSLMLMIGIWVLMTLTALLALEVNLACPDHANGFSAMAYKTLGGLGKIVTWIALLFLSYALLAAYASGATVLLKSLLDTSLNINSPSNLSAILFVCILGGAVFWSTAAVDYTNRFFIAIKALLLIASIVLLMPQVDFTNVIGYSGLHSGKYLGVAAPIFLCAFGFHTTIPSLRLYMGDKRKELRLIVICATTIPLMVYLLWLLGTLGVVPLHGDGNGSANFVAINTGGSSVDGLIAAIATIVNNKWVVAAIKGFSNISMTTSFLGVSLGLFDFLADGCRIANSRWGRFQTALLTFLLPLIFALYYPKGFIIALGYAAIFEAILVVILPALMAYKLRAQDATILTISGNKILFNKFILISAVALGIGFILLQIMSSMNLLPQL